MSDHNHDRTHLPPTDAPPHPPHPPKRSDRSARGRRYLRAGIVVVAVSAALVMLSQILLRPSTTVPFTVVMTLVQHAAVPVAAGLIGAGLVLREAGSRED